MDKFPYGRAPFWLLVVAVASTLALGITRAWRQSVRADITFATFASVHLESYQKVIDRFERAHDVKVGFELVNWDALQTRLQAAMLAGSEVPDVVEIGTGSLGFFTRGPLSEVGFVDLTERVHREHLDQRLVASRFSLWQARGHIFGIPHDVHPVMLACRRDILESLGVDMNSIQTWDQFVEVGHRVTADLNGDSIPDRYLMDLPTGAQGLQIVLYQRGGQVFDPDGNLGLDEELARKTIVWYVHQAEGPGRIGFDAGSGQAFVKAFSDGLVLCTFTPDWRSRILEEDAPHLAGKLALMPLPAWEPGGRRTSVWGGTGLVITRRGKHPELAWELAKFLYFDPAELGKRFSVTNIIPPLRDAWNLPEFKRHNAYFSNQAVGSMYAELAPTTPPFYSSPEQALGLSQLDQVYGRAVQYFREHGDRGLDDAIRVELGRMRDYMHAVMARQKLARVDR